MIHLWQVKNQKKTITDADQLLWRKIHNCNIMFTVYTESVIKYTTNAMYRRTSYVI